MRLIKWLIVLVVLVGCEARRTAQISGMEQGDTIVMLHADNLSMIESDGITYVTLRNPWDTLHTLCRYALVPDTFNNSQLSTINYQLPADITVVRTPLRRAVVYASVIAALLDELGCCDQIAGLCDGDYVVDSQLRARLADGRLTDYGNAMNPSMEMIMDTAPDALLPSAFQNTGHGGVERLGIPIIECADYMETSPLGRAEWMRFYGRLFGVGEKADSMFLAVRNHYLAVRDSIAVGNRKRPRVMCDVLTAATWYVPGAHSTMARWIEDAGGQHIFDGNDASGSVALNLETVIDRAHDADVWIIKYNQPQDYTYESLRAECSAYTQFAPYQKHRVYGCNTGRVSFYEQVPFHPDRLLSDFARIFGGEGGGEYYTPL